MRFDANISLRPEGADEFGVKVEIKNMNSLRSLQRALEYEQQRQAALLDAGEPIHQETRHWDEERNVTESGRSKEESSDYRYFPEPDLVPIAISTERLDRIRAGLPELPAERRHRLIDGGLEGAAARILARSDRLTAVFDSAVAAGAESVAAAQWLTGEVVGWARRSDVDVEELSLDGGHLAELLSMIDAGDVSSSAAKEVLSGVLEGEGSPRAVAEARDLIQIQDAGALEAAVAAVLADHPDEAARLREGDAKLIGFFTGQIMRATGGKADPRQVSELLRAEAGS